MGYRERIDPDDCVDAVETGIRQHSSATDNQAQSSSPAHQWKYLLYSIARNASKSKEETQIGAGGSSLEELYRAFDKVALEINLDEEQKDQIEQIIKVLTTVTGDSWLERLANIGNVCGFPLRTSSFESAKSNNLLQPFALQELSQGEHAKGIVSDHESDFKIHEDHSTKDYTQASSSEIVQRIELDDSSKHGASGRYSAGYEPENLVATESPRSQRRYMLHTAADRSLSLSSSSRSNDTFSALKRDMTRPAPPKNGQSLSLNATSQLMAQTSGLPHDDPSGIRQSISQLQLADEMNEEAREHANNLAESIVLASHWRRAKTCFMIWRAAARKQGQRLARSFVVAVCLDASMLQYQAMRQWYTKYKMMQQMKDKASRAYDMLQKMIYLQAWRAHFQYRKQIAYSVARKKAVKLCLKAWKDYAQSVNERTFGFQTSVWFRRWRNALIRTEQMHSRACRENQTGLKRQALLLLLFKARVESLARQVERQRCANAFAFWKALTQRILICEKRAQRMQSSEAICRSLSLWTEKLNSIRMSYSEAKYRSERVLLREMIVQWRTKRRLIIFKQRKNEEVIFQTFEMMRLKLMRIYDNDMLANAFMIRRMFYVWSMRCNLRHQSAQRMQLRYLKILLRAIILRKRMHKFDLRLADLDKSLQQQYFRQWRVRTNGIASHKRAADQALTVRQRIYANKLFVIWQVCAKEAQDCYKHAEAVFAQNLLKIIVQKWLRQHEILNKLGLESIARYQMALRSRSILAWKLAFQANRDRKLFRLMLQSARVRDQRMVEKTFLKMRLKYHSICRLQILFVTRQKGWTLRRLEMFFCRFRDQYHMQHLSARRAAVFSDRKVQSQYFVLLQAAHAAVATLDEILDEYLALRRTRSRRQMLNKWQWQVFELNQTAQRCGKLEHKKTIRLIKAAFDHWRAQRSARRKLENLTPATRRGSASATGSGPTRVLATASTRGMDSAMAKARASLRRSFR